MIIKTAPMMNIQNKYMAKRAIIVSAMKSKKNYAGMNDEEKSIFDGYEKLHVKAFKAKVK